MNRHAHSLLAASLIIGASLPAAGRFEASRYEATVELVDGGHGPYRDAVVTISVDLTYVEEKRDAVEEFVESILPEEPPKDTRFGWSHTLGRNAWYVTAAAPDGSPVNYSIHRPNKGPPWVKLHFRLLEAASRSGIIKAKVREVLAGNLEESHVELGWIGPPPGSSAEVIYRFILPEGHEIDSHWMEPVGDWNLVEKPRRALVARWSQLHGTSDFGAHFSPGVAHGRTYVSLGTLLIILGVICAIFVANASLVWWVHRRQGKK